MQHPPPQQFSIMVVTESSPNILLMSSELWDTSIVEARRFRLFEPLDLTSLSSGRPSSDCASVFGVDGADPRLDVSDMPFETVLVEVGD